MNSSGSTITFATAGAAFSEGTAPATAKPSAASENVPTSTDTITPGSVEVGRSTPYSTAPNRHTTATITNDTATAVSVRPTITTHAGTGVARTRLSWPRSRAITSQTVRFTNVALISASARIAGT